MACFAKQHFLSVDPSQEESFFETCNSKHRLPFYPTCHRHQSVDISRRSANRFPCKTFSLQRKEFRSSLVAVPFLRRGSLSFSLLHKKNQNSPPLHRETLNVSPLHRETLKFPPLHPKTLDFQQSRAEKGLLLLASAPSASYNETVEEGLLRLGGVCLSRRDLQIASGAASTIIFAVANKVLYKMALVPLKEYPFFLALINTFGYVLVYFSILYIRYQAGIVTDEMLELPKSRFVLSGALEALGVASGMAAAAVLPGTSISILLQTFLVWQLVLSMIFLKKRYSFGQIVGCTMVLAGVAIALAGSGSGLGSSADQTGLYWPLLMIFSCAFQATSTIVKEFVFQDASKQLKGGSVDIFVVNSFGSAFQAIFVLLLLPFLSQLRGVPFSELRSYMTDGAGCLFNIGSMSTECSGATLLTFSYVVVNLAFNISLLSLLKMSSAVVSSLCSTLAVPLSIYMFTLPLPYVGATASLHPRFVVGTAILLSGLAFYNYFGCFNKKFSTHEWVQAPAEQV